MPSTSSITSFPRDPQEWRSGQKRSEVNQRRLTRTPTASREITGTTSTRFSVSGYTILVLCMSAPRQVRSPRQRRRRGSARPGILPGSEQGEATVSLGSRLILHLKVIVEVDAKREFLERLKDLSRASRGCQQDESKEYDEKRPG
jgi:hypothetical protein